MRRFYPLLVLFLAMLVWSASPPGWGQSCQFDITLEQFVGDPSVLDIQVRVYTAGTAVEWPDSTHRGFRRGRVWIMLLPSLGRTKASRGYWTMKQSPLSCALSVRRLVAATLAALLAVVPAQPQGDEPPRVGGTIAYVRALDRPKVPVPGMDPPTGGPPCELRLVDVAQGVSRAVEQVSRGYPLAALSFSPSGELLLVGEDLAQDVAKTSTMWKASALWRIVPTGEATKLWEAPLGVLRWLPPVAQPPVAPSIRVVAGREADSHLRCLPRPCPG